MVTIFDMEILYSEPFSVVIFSVDEADSRSYTVETMVHGTFCVYLEFLRIVQK